MYQSSYLGSKMLRKDSEVVNGRIQARPVDRSLPAASRRSKHPSRRGLLSALVLVTGGNSECLRAKLLCFRAIERGEISSSR
jgi:hypothetical protein